MKQETEIILSYIEKNRGIDFSGNLNAFTERRINDRILFLNLTGVNEYLTFLEKNPDELDKLTEWMTIKVSEFFRNPLVFEYLAEIILPELIKMKLDSNEKTLRVWSAGCATGEEPYSIAILLHNIIKKEYPNFNISIIATDIDEKALQKAREGVYQSSAIKNIKYQHITDFFIISGNNFTLSPQIKEKVLFSKFDLLNKHTYAPPESMFGDFDIVLCRNVLIYFKEKQQEIIYNKIIGSLVVNGYLVLGEAETLPVNKKKFFLVTNNGINIYRKIFQNRRLRNEGNK